MKPIQHAHMRSVVAFWISRKHECLEWKERSEAIGEADTADSGHSGSLPSSIPQQQRGGVLLTAVNKSEEEGRCCCHDEEETVFSVAASHAHSPGR